MNVKKRKYDATYIEYGFTIIVNNGEEKSQCVICNKRLSNDFMKPTKLKQHLQRSSSTQGQGQKVFFCMS